MNYKLGKTINYGLLIGLSIISLFPFYWLVRSAFLTNSEIFAMPMVWIPSSISIENFKIAVSRFSFGRYFFNTIVIVVLSIIGTMFSSSFGAFGFARIKFKGRNFFFALVLSTMMIPYSVVLIPQFIGWKFIGAYNTYIPLIMPSFFINAFFIFLLRQFYSSIPKDYDEAAFIDGASYLSIYTKIILPMSKPALTTVAVFTFMYAWNDFLGPLIYIKDMDKYTLALGLRSFMGQYTSDWNYMMAAASLVVLPMIVLFYAAQKYFIQGIKIGGLKS